MECQTNKAFLLPAKAPNSGATPRLPFGLELTLIYYRLESDQQKDKEERMDAFNADLFISFQNMRSVYLIH